MKNITLRNMTVFYNSVSSLSNVALLPEVQHALTSWIKANLGKSPNSESGVLIGGLAMSFYAKPRYTEDVDILFLKESDIPESLEGFKAHRTGAFQENKTHVEVELATAKSINIPVALVRKVFETALDFNGIKVASREAMIALKLYGADSPRREYRDLGDLVLLFEENPDIDISDWFSLLKPHHLLRIEDIRNRARS